MKHLLKLTSLLMALLWMTTACDKDSDPVSNEKLFVEFNLEASLNEGVENDVTGIIKDHEIILEVPAAANISNLIPSYTLSNERTIVSVGGQVQQSGKTAQDFSEPVAYKITAEDNSSKTYTVKAVRSATIIAFGFYAEDNPGVLFKDYEANINGVDVEVSVPVDADITNLVARFETTSGSVVKVSGNELESGVSAIDFTSPVVFVVSDDNRSENFTITVGRLTAPEWYMIGFAGFIKPRTDELVININPVTHMPYLAFQIDGEIDGESVPSEEEKAAVMAFDGTDWQYIGPESGISDAKVDYLSLAFNTEGVPYLAYKDFFESPNKATVKAYNNGTWSTVGSERFTEGRSDYVSMVVAKDNTPYVSYSDRSGVTLPSRGFNIMKYAGASWSTGNPPAGVITGHNQLCKYNEHVYAAIMERSNGSNNPSVYKLTEGIWTVVGTPQFSAHEEAGFIQVDFAIENEEKMYLAYQVIQTEGRVNYVMMYDGTDWAAIGEGVNVGSERDNFKIAVHPNGTLYFAYVDANGLHVRTFNDETNNWNEDYLLVDQEVESFDLEISATGIPYLAAVVGDLDKTVVWTFDIP
ncbi:hypothetical protein AAG747_16250 [Rapidithrix thailandica]|uniref:DUF5018 domain-containing protein n=1 Tax=Rapidithrix thailandica TaxID=413964 RepID=A0AAW9SF50_9BACT